MLDKPLPHPSSALVKIRLFIANSLNKSDAGEMLQIWPIEDAGSWIRNFELRHCQMEVPTAPDYSINVGVPFFPS